MASSPVPLSLLTLIVLTSIVAGQRSYPYAITERSRVSVATKLESDMTSKCPFDSSDENLLARCLIRPVLRGGNSGPILSDLPQTLRELIGQPMNITPAKLRQYLADNHIGDSSVGGEVNQDVTKVRFFVIHDTSSPEIPAANFPTNMNEATWAGNRLSNWVQSDTPTHVFVNRAGESANRANFKVVVGATKYEAGRDFSNPTARRQARDRRRGLFVHIELIQPRRRSNPNSGYYDIPPSPGFTPKQMDRLALLYVVASVRSNRWLLPAFHLSVDATIADAHDDPQDFEMETWLESLSALLGKLRQ
jgi:hypothetical protein